MIPHSIIKNLIESQVKSRDNLDVFKRKMAKKYKIDIPTNMELLKVYHKLAKSKRELR